MVRATTITTLVLLCSLFSSRTALAQLPETAQPRTTTRPETSTDTPDSETQFAELRHAALRLPMAALLAAALAVRPRRRGTPQRKAPVIQTQIILAVVGAIVMLVVGSSLARAFGIVGVASLIRYRSKIDDPKDAVVMLCALAVGLASGVGLYALAVFSTFFMGAALWLNESFEPQTKKRFTLKIKAGKDTDAIRSKIERILARYRIEFELRSSSDDEVCYDVQVPLEVPTDRVSNAILRLDPEGHLAVDWADKSEKKK